MTKWVDGNKIEEVKKINELVLSEFYKAIVGKGIGELLLVSLYSGGHVLLEGVPGVGKTTIAKTFAKILGCTFKRVQFTPDLLPSDIIGTYIFNPATSQFQLHKGPVFANVVLVDEINRGLPKTQSALLEAMQERQVTIEGTTLELPEPFIVIATQNPVEFEGVYPLPEAQVDRFLMKIKVGYPDKSEEMTIVRRYVSNSPITVSQVLNEDKIKDIMKLVDLIYVDDSIVEYVVDLIKYIRGHENVLLGPGPRASIYLLKACKAKALIEGRDYVIPDDVKSMILSVLNHRIVLKPEAELDGIKPEDVVSGALNKVEVPARP